MQRYVVLFEGDIGPQVKDLQEYLNVLRGISINETVQKLAPLQLDGIFDAKTKELLKLTCGTDYGIVETEGKPLSIIRKKIIQEALLKLKNPLSRTSNDFIEKEVIEPTKKKIHNWSCAWCAYILRRERNTLDAAFPLVPVETASGTLISTDVFLKEAERVHAILENKNHLLPGDMMVFKDNHMGFYYDTVPSGEIISLEGDVSNAERIVFRNRNSIVAVINLELFVMQYQYHKQTKQPSNEANN